MNRLTAHVLISVLGHLSLNVLVLGELVAHVLQDLVRFFKDHELQQVHVILEAHIEVLLPLQIHELKRLHIVLLDGQLHRSHALVLPIQGSLSCGNGNAVIRSTWAGAGVLRDEVGVA